MSRFLPPGRTVIAAPNPAHDSIKVYYRLEKSAPVRLLLVNSAGEIVLTKSLGPRPAGEGSTFLDLQELASGVYVLVVQSNEGYGYKNVGTFKVAVLK